jgi:N-acetylglucosaminyl-diphospho-decaprenol L-rhamnosyltransferase
MICISIISHGHGTMVEALVAELLVCPEIGTVLVTKNIPESLSLPQDARIQIIDNMTPAGFSANHNRAFTFCTLPYFCPLNPDITLQGNPFPLLLKAMEEAGAAVAAPLIKNSKGQVEDSIRPFPTIRSLLLKALLLSNNSYAVQEGSPAFYPEWVAGMFMLFHSSDFKRLGGFDAGFFLYYEDVDICVRVWKEGMKVIACPTVSIVHDARRASHKDIAHMWLHMGSMFRYFLKHWQRLPSLPLHSGNLI